MIKDPLLKIRLASSKQLLVTILKAHCEETGRNEGNSISHVVMPEAPEMCSV